MKIYLAAQYSQKDLLKTYAQELRDQGITVTSRWLEEPHSANVTMDQIDFDRLEYYADMDFEDVGAADLLIFFAQDPNVAVKRGGRHVEFGMAMALGKPIVVVGPRENIFHYRIGVIHKADWESAKKLITDVNSDLGQKVTFRSYKLA